MVDKSASWQKKLISLKINLSSDTLKVLAQMLQACHDTTTMTVDEVPEKLDHYF